VAGVTVVNAPHYTGFYLLSTEAAISKIAIQPRMVYTLYRKKYSSGLRKKDGDRSLSSEDAITYRSRTDGMYRIFNVAFS